MKFFTANDPKIIEDGYRYLEENRLDQTAEKIPDLRIDVSFVKKSKEHIDEKERIVDVEGKKEMSEKEIAEQSELLKIWENTPTKIP